MAAGGFVCCGFFFLPKAKLHAKGLNSWSAVRVATASDRKLKETASSDNLPENKQLLSRS